MTTTKHSPPTSAFGQAALVLDQELTQFEKLTRELESLSIESDKGLNRALTLIAETHACRLRMQASMQAFSQTLQEVQKNNTIAEEVLAAKTGKVQERQQIAEQMMKKFQLLGETVKQVEATAAHLKKAVGDKEESAESKQELLNGLPELDTQLAVLVDETCKLVEEAHSANMQTLERNADALRKSLSAARNRLQLAGQNRQLH